jgi:hypothetical protein
MSVFEMCVVVCRSLKGPADRGAYVLMKALWNIDSAAVRRLFPWLGDEEVPVAAVVASGRGRQNEILKALPHIVFAGDWPGALAKPRPAVWSRTGEPEEDSAQAEWLADAKHNNLIPVSAPCV